MIYIVLHTWRIYLHNRAIFSVDIQKVSVPPTKSFRELHERQDSEIEVCDFYIFISFFLRANDSGLGTEC